ncbi:MAG: hypothetical protein RSB77_02320 [Bacilli bacterium]
MKKVLIFLLFFLFSIFIVCINNETFFYNYYNIISNNDNEIKISVPYFSYLTKEESNKVVLISLKSKKKLDSEIKKYLNTLNTCYNNTIKNKSDITIKKYTVKDIKYYRIITLEYLKYNKCLKEFTLEDNWRNKIATSNITNSYFKIEDKIIPIEHNKLTNIINRIDERLKMKCNKNIKTTGKIRLEANYEIYGKKYNFIMFSYQNNSLVIKVIDQNGNTKIALYEAINSDNLMEDLYNE